MKKILKNKFKDRKNQKGFVILIAIVVSALLVSLGVFITNIAYKELQLSTSIKESQKAFYVADTVIECALNFDNNDPKGFIENKTDCDGRSDEEKKFSCNGYKFKLDDDTCGDIATDDEIDIPTGCIPPPPPPATPPANACTGKVNRGSAELTYYVSFAEDTDGDHSLSQTEIENQRDKPYAKLEVSKKYNQEDKPQQETILTAYGHNKYLGVGIVERALQVTY